MKISLSVTPLWMTLIWILSENTLIRLVMEKISGAAILLFGKNPQRFFQRVPVHFIHYEGTEARADKEMNVIKDVIFQGQILDIVRKATQFVKGQIREHTFLGQDGSLSPSLNCLNSAGLS